MYPLLSTVTRSAQATMTPFWNKPPRRLTLTHSKPAAQYQTQRHLVEIKKQQQPTMQNKTLNIRLIFHLYNSSSN